MESEIKTISTTSILVSARIRKEAGDLTDLAESIQKNGLINPITVMDCQNGTYQLIAGLRRLEAAKRIQMTELCATVLSPVQVEEMLALEIAENEQRLDFTTAERLEYAERIKAIEQAKARERMVLGGKGGFERTEINNEGKGKRAYLQRGQSRDHIAKKVGFTSSRQMERAGKIAEERPDLLSKIDAGEATIYGIYKDVISCDSIKVPTIADQVARAGVIRLMKNPHFLELREELENMHTKATAAKNTLKRATEVYDNKVKHFDNNIDFLSRRLRELEQENAELRAQLGMGTRAVKRVEFGNPDGIIKNVDGTIS